MLGNNHLNAFLPSSNKEVRDIPQRGPLVNEAIFDVVGRSTGGTDYFLPQEYSCCKVGIVIATEAGGGKISVIVSGYDNLICGVEGLIIIGVTDRHLDHLTVG